MSCRLDKCLFMYFFSVLIFEPDNPEALKFHPIILEKIKLGKNCDKINLVLELHLSMNCFRLF